jgi:Icc-related predicted phosphoesterase
VDDIRLSAAAPQGVEPARAYPPRPDGLVLRFAVVGDTQMRYPMKHANKYSILGTVVPVLNRLAPDAAFFVGDLIDMRTDPPDKAEEEAKEYYGVWLKQVADLKMPWHPIRGNHDPLPYYANHVKKEIDYVVETKGVTFICFSSAHPTDGGGWEHMGAVSPEQRKWMEEEMRKAAAKGNRIVTLTHITSMPNQHPLTGWYIREGGEALRKLYEKHGVVAEISGHMHRWLASGEINGVQYIIAPTVRETEGRLAGHGIAVYDVLPDRILQYEKMAHGPYRTEWGKWAKHEIPLPPKRTTP